MANISEVLGRNIDSVKELKKAIGELQNSLIGLDSESQEFKDTSMKLAAAQDELTKVTKAGKEENVAATDSIVGMEQEYKKLYNTYKMLSDEQRNSDFGKNMAESLETLSTKLNETKQGVGNFKDNIGRYAGSVTEAFNSMGVSAGALQGPLKTATTGAKGFNTALKSLAANPVVLILATLVAILGKAADAIKNNEELTNRLKEAMAVFKPVLDAVSNAFDFLAGILVKTVEGLTKVASKIMSVIPGMKDAIKSHQDLAKATNDLTKAQRENSVVASEKQAEIERLREEASATDDVVEKKKLLEEAKAMQAEVDQKEIELAQEELRILQEYGEKTANSAEENEKLAAAQKKVNDAIAQGERNMRMYNKQLDATEKSTKSATSAGKNYREEAKKLYQELLDNNKTEIQKITEKYEKEKKLLEKYHYDTKLLTKKYNEDVSKVQMEEVKKTMNTMSTMYSEYYDNMSRYYKNWKNSASSAWEEDFIDVAVLQDALNALNDFQASATTIIGDTKDTFGQLFKTLFENGDISKLTDYKTAEDIINHFAPDDATAKKMLTVFHGFGEEAWMEYISGMTENVKELNSVFNLDIKNLPDAAARAEELGKELAVKFGDEAIHNVEDYVKRASTRIMDLVYMMIEKGPVPDDKIWPDPSVFNMERMREFILEEEYKMLEFQKTTIELELENFSGTTEQKLEILERYYAIVDEMDARHQALSELNQQRTLEMVQNLGDAMDNIGSSLSTVKSSYETLIDSEVKAGQIDEKEAEKKKKRLQKLEIATQAFNIATIAADAASGLFSIWKGYASEVGTVNPQTAAAAGPAAAAVLAGLNTKSLVSAIAKSTGLAATASAQIIAAKNGIVTAQNNMSASDSGGGADAGVGVTPVLIDSTPFSYVRTIQSESDTDEINKYNLWVAVSDIESGLGQRVKVTDESSF